MITGSFTLPVILAILATLVKLTHTPMARPELFFANPDSITQVQITLSGDWLCGQVLPDFSPSENNIADQSVLTFHCENSFHWDSRFIAWLLNLKVTCDPSCIILDVRQLPSEVQQLFQLATAVPVNSQSRAPSISFYRKWIKSGRQLFSKSVELVEFTGEVTLGLLRLLRLKSDARVNDIVSCLIQAGPSALAIVTLLSFLVGMILAYLGLVQLRQFGVEVYVANLVGLGMVREMAALMTGIIMAGRTGAAYAAELGTMQVNEELDALNTLGINTVDYLVMPRVLALMIAMPLLSIYSNILGMLGGGVVALGMDISATQYIHQLSLSFDYADVLTGVFKSVVFALLIGLAGCKAGINCGRSSDAVGKATTQAVVSAIVCLVVADALLNIIYFQVGI